MLRHSFRNLLTGVALLVSTGAANALSIDECGDMAHLANLGEPVEDFTRSYSNGAVRVWHIDIGHPACCGSYLAVIMPPPADEPGEYRQCFLIRHEGNGFQWIRMKEIVSSYSAARGLLLKVPVRLYNPDNESRPKPAFFEIRINQQTGTVAFE